MLIMNKHAYCLPYLLFNEYCDDALLLYQFIIISLVKRKTSLILIGTFRMSLSTSLVQLISD